MRFLKTHAVITAIILMFILAACSKGGIELNTEISPPDKSLIDLATKTYEDMQLAEIVKFSGNITELNNRFPIDCIRMDDGIYRVSYLGCERIAVILFDASGNKLFGKVYSAQRLMTEFDGIAEGLMLDEVQVVDPDGEYAFLYTGRNDFPKVSLHCTKDGYLITIEYSANNTITSITKHLI